MKKQQVIDQIEQGFQAFKDASAGLTDAQMLEPGVSGNWSVRDILAHVNGWEEEALKYLPVILKGGQSPRYSQLYGGIDAFNAQMTDLRKNLSLAEVRDRLERTHRQLIEFIEEVDEQQFKAETRFRRRLKWDTFAHYPEHEKAIREWCKKQA